MNRFRMIIGKAVAVEIWIVGGLTIASFVREFILPITFLCASLFWILRGLAFGRLTRRTPSDWAILWLVSLLPFTAWTTSVAPITSSQIFRLLNGIALYYAIVNWVVTTTRLQWLARGVAACGLSLALYAFVSVQWFTEKLRFIPFSLFSHFRLLGSDSIHPNVMAGTLILLLPILLGLLWFAWKQVHHLERIAFALTLALMAVVLFLTVSRGAWLAFGFSLLALTLIKWPRTGPVLIVALTVTSIALYIWTNGRIFEILVTSGMLGGIGGRLEVWSRAITIIQDFPFTGIGMGSFGFVADTMYPFSLFEAGAIPHAHNLFLQVAIDLGIPGLIGWLAVFLTMLFISWQNYRAGQTSGNSWMSGLGAGLFCSQLALAIHGLLDSVTWGMVRPAPLVWVVWGIIAAAWLLNLETRKNDSAL